MHIIYPTCDSNFHDHINSNLSPHQMVLDLPHTTVPISPIFEPSSHTSSLPIAPIITNTPPEPVISNTSIPQPSAQPISHQSLLHHSTHCIKPPSHFKDYVAYHSTLLMPMKALSRAMFSICHPLY